MPLEPEDLQHLTAAEGYLELGMPIEANDEVEQIDPDVRHVPEVLSARIAIYHRLQKWELMRIVAEKMTDYDPEEPKWAISLAVAVRRGRASGALEIIRQSVKRHPDVALLRYHLACVECQAGDLEAAGESLRRTFDLDKRLRRLALNETDLDAIWAKS